MFGIKDFLLVFEKDWQVALFRNFVQNNFFPKARYRTCLLDWQKSKNPFAYKEIHSFITNSAFIFSHGDIFYNSEILEKYKAFGNKKSVCMYDAHKNLYSVPVLFQKTEANLLSHISSLNIQAFLKKHVSAIPYSSDCININTLKDLKFFIRFLTETERAKAKRKG